MSTPKRPGDAASQPEWIIHFVFLLTPIGEAQKDGNTAKQVQKRLTGNSLIAANYTWSKNLTTASNDYRAPQYTYDLLAEYGHAEAFNVLNPTNFNGFLSTRAGSSLFGKIASARDPRIMKLALN